MFKILSNFFQSIFYPSVTIVDFRGLDNHKNGDICYIGNRSYQYHAWKIFHRWESLDDQITILKKYNYSYVSFSEESPLKFQWELKDSKHMHICTGQEFQILDTIQQYL